MSPETLDRFRVAVVTGHLPSDLGEEVLELLTAPPKGGRQQRVAERNELLRKAAALVSGSAWAKARRIQREIESPTGGDDTDGVRAIVRRALEIDRFAPAPQSMKQLLRILSG